MTDTEKLRILELKGRGETVREIATKMNRSRTTVKRWLARHELTGEMITAPRAGRPRCTTRDDDARLCEIATENPDASIPQLLAHRDDPAPIISRWTATRRLRAAGLRQKIAKGRDSALGTERVQAARLEWAERIAREWEGWHDRTVWVDESCFCSFSTVRRRVWVPAAHRGRVTRWHRRSGRGSVYLFGGLVGDKLLPPVVSDCAHTSWLIADYIHELYMPVLRDELGAGQFKWQWDNAPTHKGPAIEQVRAEDTDFGNAVMYQPPYSPDLNPIEHVWARMKRKLRTRIYRDVKSLRRAVLEAYEEVSRDSQFLSRLSCSMPRRLNAVIAAEGGPTRY